MKPKTYHASEHDIQSSLVDADAVYVIERLRKAGYEAYLVGGSVRDLLAQKEPKDFDISTSARPEEIKRLFRGKCLLIGRRFRLAHLRFGSKVLEVSTFRSGENGDELITRDNVWGTPEEDVLRRDFTINGLFYDPSSHTVIDYVGGWEDIHKGVLRSIGDPVVRFKQDPVRMIRLLKFQARFGFAVSDKCASALERCKEEIAKSSPPRVLEEIFRMLESGSAEHFFRIMAEKGMLELLFPQIAEFMKGPEGDQILRYLKAADTLNTKSLDRSLSRAALASCLLFPIVDYRLKKEFIEEGKTPHFGDVILVISSVIKELASSSFSHFPRRLTMAINFIISTQYRFTPFSGKRHHRPKLFQQKEFSHALQFFRLRTFVDGSLNESYSHWKDLARQKKSKQGHKPHPPPGKKRPRRRRRR